MGGLRFSQTTRFAELNVSINNTPWKIRVQTLNVVNVKGKFIHKELKRTAEL